MAQTIKLKRSAVQGNTPSTTDLALGEVAINTYDGKIFIKKDDGTETVVEVGTNPSSITTAAGSFTTLSVSGDLVAGSIATTLADTAVDVFVYDTSRDSDGGAWRHRTQHTSWYNETLNTATRGSRREFPAVAVIVAEIDKVTIYDGDDPTLPMWMVFDGGTTNWLYYSTSSTKTSCVTALNGKIVTGNELYDVRIWDFLADGSIYWRERGVADYYGSVSQRNDGLGQETLLSGSSGIVNRNVNDVAMTVLPNAPIDPATGLPVPTIAVATSGGYSQIGWDGVSTDNVWDAVSPNSGSSKWSRVEFTKSNQIIANLGYENNSAYGSIVVFDPLTADVSYAGSSLNDTTSQTFSIFEVYNGASQAVQIDLRGASALRNTRISALGNSIAVKTTERSALALVERNPDAPETGMHALLTSTYNTGYMPANIKGAFLSDTDDTDLVGTTVFDVDFSAYADQAAAEADGWEFGTGWSFSLGQAVFTAGSPGKLRKQVTTPIGNLYVVQIDGTKGGGAFVSLNLSDQGVFAGGIGNGAQTYTVQSEDTSQFFEVSAGANGDYTLDTVSIKLADADRSVNNNGLIVNGTVTRTAVATGADLVAYIGFSASNYLEQPYNSNLDFGTGDFCVMGWVRTASVGTDLILDARDSGNTEGFFLFVDSSGYVAFATRASSTTSFVTGTRSIVNSGWTFVTAVVSNTGTSLDLYLNGELHNSATVTARSIGGSDEPIRIGLAYNDTSAFAGSLALLRVSATAPTAEQIAKIYEDEKFLFQDGAQATLYGSSNGVTALAHDEVTDLLHVGTSAGRSVFQGLRRVDNTTDAVGVAISAYDDLVVED